MSISESQACVYFIFCFFSLSKHAPEILGKIFIKPTPAIQERFDKAWNQADVRLTASRFMDEAHTNVAMKISQLGGFRISQ